MKNWIVDLLVAVWVGSVLYSISTNDYKGTSVAFGVIVVFGLFGKAKWPALASLLALVAQVLWYGK